ncbi:hypothetical protein ACVINI_000790 [Rhizobium beringeri]|jgi:branched-chain amino acid aminotransferase
MASVPFDQLDGEISFNGELVAWKDAKIHVLTHGLHYASAVFEGEAPMAAGCLSSPNITSVCTDPLRSAASKLPYSVELLKRQGVHDAYVR